MLTAPNGGTPGVQLYTTAADPTGQASDDAQLKNQVRCNYVKAASNSAQFGNPSDLDPDPGSEHRRRYPIFTASDFSSSDVAMTATVMKLVLNGFAGAGTITLGGFDYHDNTRATGEMRNFQAGQMIGAVLEYAQRISKPVMIYVFSDGSLTSSSMVDTTPRAATSSPGRATPRRSPRPSSWSTVPAAGRSRSTAPPASRSATSAPTARW